MYETRVNFGGNARFGDDGKIWHLGAAIAVGTVLWAIMIGTTISIVRLILGY